MPSKARPQYEALQAYILERTALWQERMGLGHFYIDTVFVDEYYEASSDDFQVTAIAMTRWAYQEAKIKWYLPSAIRHSEDRIDATVVHELCHVLLGAEQALIDVKLEQVARTVAGEDAEHVAVMYYEALETATEGASRAIRAGWASLDAAEEGGASLKTG